MPEASALPVFTNGRKRSASLVADGRRIRIGIRIRDNDRPRSLKDRPILADARRQCVLRNPHQCPASCRLSVSSALRVQRTLGCAAADDHQNWEAAIPQSSPQRSSSAASRHGLCDFVRRSGRRACRRGCRKILASRWRALSRPHCGGFWRVCTPRIRKGSVELQVQNRVGCVYGAFNRDEDQMLRSSGIVEVSSLLESHQPVLWTDPHGDAQGCEGESRVNPYTGFLKITKYRKSGMCRHRPNWRSTVELASAGHVAAVRSAFPGSDARCRRVQRVTPGV